jgi:hypothetical protein
VTCGEGKGREEGEGRLLLPAGQAGMTLSTELTRGGGGDGGDRLTLLSSTGMGTSGSWLSLSSETTVRSGKAFFSP